MEKQYIQEKNEKLGAKKEDIKSFSKNEVKEEKTETAEVKTDATEVKEEKKKTEKKQIIKKEKAIVNGNDLGISKKHSMAICDYIRGKEIENMIVDLEKVVSLTRPIPMRGEIPHRKGNIMSGRYPVNASKVFIKLLKTLNANCSVNGLENPRITVAIANDASRPFKRGGSMRFKRTNVHLEASELKNSDSAQKSEISDTREKVKKIESKGEK